MKTTKAHKKAPHKALSVPGAGPGHQEEAHIDAVVTGVISGLDLFIAQANSAGIGTLARILHNAKEELVYWAVHMNFHESAQDKFFNRLMYSNAMFAAADFISKFGSVEDKKKLLSTLETGQLGTSFPPVAEMRSQANG